MERQNQPFRFQNWVSEFKLLIIKTSYNKTAPGDKRLDKLHIIKLFRLLTYFVNSWKQLLNKNSSRNECFL